MNICGQMMDNILTGMKLYIQINIVMMFQTQAIVSVTIMTVMMMMMAITEGNNITDYNHS